MSWLRRRGVATGVLLEEPGALASRTGRVFGRWGIDTGEEALLFLIGLVSFFPKVVDDSSAVRRLGRSGISVVLLEKPRNRGSFSRNCFDAEGDWFRCNTLDASDSDDSRGSI